MVYRTRTSSCLSSGGVGLWLSIALDKLTILGNFEILVIFCVVQYVDLVVGWSDVTELERGILRKYVHRSTRLT